MKTKIFFILFTLACISKLSASVPLYMNYNSDKVSISQFLGFYGDFYEDNDMNELYTDIKEKFNQFCYFTDTLFEISSRTGKKISFYSQIDGSEISVGEKSFYFVPEQYKNAYKNKDYFFTDSYNNPCFLILYVCNKLDLPVPEVSAKDRTLYSLETESEIKINIYEDTNLLFCYPGMEGIFNPYFKLNDKNYIGLYYSEKDAEKIKKLLNEKYSVKCIVKDFERNFEIVDKAYFRIKEHL